MKNNDCIIVGAGITGCVLAERLSSVGKRVLVIEKRSHIGGNCYDYYNKAGILVHKYGPHIFHTDDKNVFEYLSNFTEWHNYEHRVLAQVDGRKIPVPFNFNTLYEVFPEEQAKRLEDKLAKIYPPTHKLSILELKKEAKDEDLKFLAQYIYDKIYKNYTAKQWGVELEMLSPEVAARIPIFIGRDNRYFHDRYQGIPKEGYTKMFERMLANKNIEIKLNTNFKKFKHKAKFGLMIYTGPIDEFFDYKFGKLEYRCVMIDFKTLTQESYQPVAVVNYPELKYPFTRITEFKKLTQQKHKKTTIGIEYPGNRGFLGWPFLNEKNEIIFQKYWKEANKLKKQNIYFAGRLAEYKYYDMDDAVKNSLNLFNQICHERDEK